MNEHIHQRKKRNSSKVNLTISVVFHTLLFSGVAYWAAHEGLLGHRIRELTVTMAPKEKKPEAPKPKPPEPKIEAPKPVEAPKIAVAAPPPSAAPVAPPPADMPVAAAPAAVTVPDMVFDGGKEVQTVSDPNAIYKGLVEHALRSHWDRPEDIADETFVAEMNLNIDSDGRVTGHSWLKQTGNRRWDKSVEEAIAATKGLSSPPPKGFPASVVVRFDVESLRTEEVAQVNPR